MLSKIKRQDCLDQYQVFPLRGYDYENDEETFFFPKVIKSYLLTIPAKTFKGNAKALGTEVTRLAMALRSDTLLFLGDTEIPWQYQSNEYKPVKEAQEYLTSHKIGKRFNGALRADMEELPVFIKHLTWLTRCNASLPYFYFIDKDQSIIGEICQYGNLHLSILDKRTVKVFEQFMNTSRFIYGDNKSCFNRFGKKSAISGRRINV